MDTKTLLATKARIDALMKRREQYLEAQFGPYTSDDTLELLEIMQSIIDMLLVEAGNREY